MWFDKPGASSGVGVQGKGLLEATRRKQTLPGPPTFELAIG
jgi:hypothetical protein